MKVTLHIGQSKTGTSAIQAFLTLNRQALLDQGILYPTVSVWGMPLDIGSHNAVADAIAGKRVYPYFSAEQYRRRFFADAARSGAHHLLLSAEHFFGGEPRVWNVPNEEGYFRLYREKVQNTADWLAGHDVNVLVYLRPHNAWFASAIAQTIRTAGLSKGLDANLSDEGYFDLLRPLMQYTRILSIWREVVTPNIQIVPYKRSGLKDGSSIADFMHRVGIDPEPLTHGTADLDVNTSLSNDCLEIKRSLNTQRRSRTRERLAIKYLEQVTAQLGGDTRYRVHPYAVSKVNDLAKSDTEALKDRLGVVLEPDAPDDRPVRLNLPPTEAQKAFETRYCSFRALADYANLLSRAVLRERALPLHALLHQARRRQMDTRYRRRS